MDLTSDYKIIGFPIRGSPVADLYLKAHTEIA